MKLSDIITHIKASVPSLHQRVEGATSFADLGENGVVRGEQAWVVPLSESTSPNTLNANAVRQKVMDQIGIVVAVRNVRDPRGEAAHDGGLNTIRGELMAAMIGWVPAAGYNVFEYAGGKLLFMKHGAVYWVFRFSTWHHESNI